MADSSPQTELLPKAGGQDSDSLPAALMWVKDAPLFIDDASLDRFYDAVVRPTFRESGPRTIKISEEQKNELRGVLKAGAKAHLPSWLSGILSAGVDLNAEGEKKSSDATAEVTELKLEAISTPQRQLEQLTVYYMLRLRDRLLAGSLDAPSRWQESGAAAAVPRALVFVDLTAGTKLIPMAAEFKNGHIVTFYDQMRARSGEYPPDYEPDRKRKYWAWYATHFDPTKAIGLIERAAVAQNERVEWIDFRVPMNDAVDTMHLHITAGGRYSTGTFAYQLVQRCEGHGIRLVGTLKDGPHINVLAIYEK
jgi:hypothetical protein